MKEEDQIEAAVHIAISLRAIAICTIFGLVVLFAHVARHW